MDLFLCILGLRTANGQMEPPRVIFHIANWKRWPIGRSIIYHDDLPIQNARDFLWLLVGGWALPLWKKWWSSSVGIKWHSQLFMESHNPAMFQSPPTRLFFHMFQAVKQNPVLFFKVPSLHHRCARAHAPMAAPIPRRRCSWQTGWGHTSSVPTIKINDYQESTGLVDVGWCWLQFALANWIQHMIQRDTCHGTLVQYNLQATFWSLFTAPQTTWCCGPIFTATFKKKSCFSSCQGMSSEKNVTCNVQLASLACKIAQLQEDYT